MILVASCARKKQFESFSAREDDTRVWHCSLTGLCTMPLRLAEILEVRRRRLLVAVGRLAHQSRRQRTKVAEVTQSPTQKKPGWRVMFSERSFGVAS